MHAHEQQSRYETTVQAPTTTEARRQEQCARSAGIVAPTYTHTGQHAPSRIDVEPVQELILAEHRLAQALQRFSSISSRMGLVPDWEQVVQRHVGMDGGDEPSGGWFGSGQQEKHTAAHPGARMVTSSFSAVGLVTSEANHASAASSGTGGGAVEFTKIRNPPASAPASNGRDGISSEATDEGSDTASGVLDFSKTAAAVSTSAYVPALHATSGGDANDTATTAKRPALPVRQPLLKQPAAPQLRQEHVEDGKETAAFLRSFRTGYELRPGSSSARASSSTASSPTLTSVATSLPTLRKINGRIGTGRMHAPSGEKKGKGRARAAPHAAGSSAVQQEVHT
ncbi:hypothetical protein OC835_007849, partial [Tilletia horrida]